MGRSADNPVKEALADLGSVTVLFLESLRSIAAKRFRFRDLVEQIHFIGVKSQSVVLLTGAFTGMVMCAQFYIQFHKVKMDSAVMSVVSVAMARELGAVLTSLMIAGRVGAAMAAQQAAALVRAGGVHRRRDGLGGSGQQPHLAGSFGSLCAGGYTGGG